MKRFIVLLIALTLLVPAFAQGAAKVKIGFVNSITGPEAPIGENLTNGVTLALEDLKVRGIDVDLVKDDDTGKPEKSMAALYKFATRRNVGGYAWSYSTQCCPHRIEDADTYT